MSSKYFPPEKINSEVNYEDTKVPLHQRTGKDPERQPPFFLSWTVVSAFTSHRKGDGQ